MHLSWRDVPPCPGGPLIPTSVTAAEAARLAALADGRDVLEVGSAYGYSAAVMACGGARHVTAVDPHAQLGSHEAMLANLTAAGVAGQVTVVREFSGQALPGMTQLGFGLVFIDGDHAYGSVLADVKAALPLIRPGGFLACHDYGEDCCCVGVRQALDELFPDGPAELVDTLFVVET